MKKEQLEVYISNETNSEENPGYDVDVFIVFEDGDSQREEDLTKCGFSTFEKAEQYISELKTKYEVKRID